MKEDKSTLGEARQEQHELETAEVLFLLLKESKYFLPTIDAQKIPRHFYRT